MYIHEIVSSTQLYVNMEQFWENFVNVLFSYIDFERTVNLRTDVNSMLRNIVSMVV